MNKLLTGFQKNDFSLKNHIVMAPMTRSRAIGNLPNDLMATYYSQRSGAGLIITEGTAPAPEALSYPRMPGIFSQEQIDCWKKTTEAVHNNNSKIFLQIMHTGRMGHIDNLPDGYDLVGASSIKASGQIATDTAGMQDFSQPKPLSIEEIRNVTNGFVAAGKNAIEAGFDGVELHGANGYLMEQFINPNVNDRIDEYGGSIEKRAKFTLEIAKETVAAIGKEKVGIRFSPFSATGDMKEYDEINDTYVYLATELNKMGIQYIHIVNHPSIPTKMLEDIRNSFNGIIIMAGGYNPQTAEQAITNGTADIVAFGKAFLSNPDFDKRIEKNAALNPVDFTTLYAVPDEKGYTDYPTLTQTLTATK